MKHDTYEKYVAMDTDLPQRALLTAWDCLCQYHDDLVLAGGLAVKYLTLPPAQGGPGPITLDVDFGIHLGASAGQYSSMRDLLGSHGFDWSHDDKRFLRKFDELDLYIDLLTEDGESNMGTAIVDDSLPVGTIPGINRALEKHRWVDITGKTLVGSAMTQSIKVAEVGPMLALKLNAFGGPKGRKSPKDAHDIFYLANNYLEGVDAAILAFREERAAGNYAVTLAEAALKNYFLDDEAEGPLACVAFRMNNQHDLPEFAEESLQLRQQFVTLALELLS
jgi:hypothetical protein